MLCSGIALTEVPPRGPTLFVLDAMFGRPKLHRYLIKEDKLQSCEYEPLVYFGSARSKLRFFAIHNDKILASDLGEFVIFFRGKVFVVFFLITFIYFY